jgi:hypothetical protein
VATTINDSLLQNRRTRPTNELAAIHVNSLHGQPATRSHLQLAVAAAEDWSQTSATTHRGASPHGPQPIESSPTPCRSPKKGLDKHVVRLLTSLPWPATATGVAGPPEQPVWLPHRLRVAAPLPRHRTTTLPPTLSQAASHYHTTGLCAGRPNPAKGTPDPSTAGRNSAASRHLNGEQPPPPPPSLCAWHPPRLAGSTRGRTGSGPREPRCRRCTTGRRSGAAP